ncbi:MFS transporter [Legionella israelensis]|uniref:MFS transporter n=1 Tax=Legionella israelensis TaxID=454 RepID=UPI0011815B8A|nr:MFS transporter [Legionella israelensis]QDP73420.1 MFS transporter [Legionella israelensis]
MVQPLIHISRKQALIFAAFLVLYEFLTYIANDMIMPGMIKVVNSFNAPESVVANSLTAYVLGGASLQLFLGPISDRYGRRPVMLTGVVIFFLCTVFIASSNSMEQFIIARFFQGMGLCFIGVIGYATLQEIFAEVDAVKLIAIMANVSILAPLLGPLLGSIFIHFFTWRLIFVCIASFTLLALWGLWHFMPEPVGQTKRDGEIIPRVSLLPRTIAHNYKQLFVNRSFFLGSVAMGVLTVPCICWIALAPVMLMAEAKLTVIQYALWQLPVFGASILGNWALHYLSSHYTLRYILAIGSIISLVSLLMVCLLSFLIPHSFLGLMPGLIFYFFGLGISNGPLGRLILFSTPVAKGTASALMTMILMCLLALGIEIANLLYFQHDNQILANYFALTGILYIIVISLAFYLNPKPHNGRTE